MKLEPPDTLLYQMALADAHIRKLMKTTKEDLLRLYGKTKEEPHVNSR